MSLLGSELMRVVWMFRKLGFAALKAFPMSLWTFPLVEFITRSNDRESRSWDRVFKTACTGDHAGVDIIVSLYRFEAFAETLFGSLRGQNCTKVKIYVEVVDPSQSEFPIIEQLEELENVVVTVSQQRKGIYESWNSLIQLGSAPLITNLNADDLRLCGSVCSVARAVSNLEGDGFYSDFYLTGDLRELEPDQTTRFISCLPLEMNLIELFQRSNNLMHCAPVWKRSLHEELGLFRPELRSSGDSEFWLRALSAGAKFVKALEKPTVVYYHNPQGLSSSLQSKGHSEWKEIRRQFFRNDPTS